MLSMPYMTEKNDNPVPEKGFGGDIPLYLQERFNQVVRRGQWKKKRVIAAAVYMFLEAAGKAKRLNETEAAKFYYDVDKFYKPGNHPTIDIPALADEFEDQMKKSKGKGFGESRGRSSA